MSNTWVTYPQEGDNPGKPGLIPHKARNHKGFLVKGGLCLQAPAWGWARGLSGSW
ncbi:hypothetical protein HG1285_03293 [Hydrogenivirga sp. 128-5-R1-1]|nr:hypothetical protein HG1285_03293 [Hydrogenivirga sp. 128-5-R1-1]